NLKELRSSWCLFSGVDGSRSRSRSGSSGSVVAEDGQFLGRLFRFAGSGFGLVLETIVGGIGVFVVRGRGRGKFFVVFRVVFGFSLGGPFWLGLGFRFWRFQRGHEARGWR